MANPAGAAVAPTAAGGQQQQRQRQNPLFGILRMIAMWYMFKTFFGGGSQKKLSREEMLVPQFPKGTPLDMNLYLSENSSFSSFEDPKALLWPVKSFSLGVEADQSINITYAPSQVCCPGAHRNASFYRGAPSFNARDCKRQCKAVLVLPCWDLSYRLCFPGGAEQWQCVRARLLCSSWLFNRSFR